MTMRVRREIPESTSYVRAEACYNNPCLCVIVLSRSHETWASIRGRRTVHVAVLENTFAWPANSTLSIPKFGHLCNILSILKRLLVIAKPMRSRWRALHLYITSQIVLCNDQMYSSVQRQ